MGEKNDPHNETFIPGIGQKAATSAPVLYQTSQGISDEHMLPLYMHIGVPRLLPLQFHLEYTPRPETLPYPAAKDTPSHTAVFKSGKTGFQT